MGIVELVVIQLKKEKRRWYRTAAILTVLALLVALGVSWSLRMRGITIANGAACGIEEHSHGDQCPGEWVLTCGYTTEEECWEVVEEEYIEEVYWEEVAEEVIEEEISEEIFEEEIVEEIIEEIPEHIHDDSCYGYVSYCEIEEHIHTVSCYPDSTADIESAVVWEADLPDLTGEWAQDLALIARSQLGCRESERNYLLAEDGQTRNGITRYGQWYGNPYGDWSSMFVLFCLNYAEIPETAIPWSPGVYNMMRLAQDSGIINQPDDNMEAVGNILFLDTDGNGNADRSAIIVGNTDEEWIAVAGDWENAVKEIPVADYHSQIQGYIHVTSVWDSYRMEDTEQKDLTQPTGETAPEESADTTLPNDETVPTNAADPMQPNDETTPDETTDVSENGDDTQPGITLNLEFPGDGVMRITAQLTNIAQSRFLWQWQVSEDGNEPWQDMEGAQGLVYETEGTEENLRRFYRLQGSPAPVMFRAVAPAAASETNAIAVADDGTIQSGAISPFSIGRDYNGFLIDVYAIPVDSTGKRIAELEVRELDSFRVNSTTKIYVEEKFDDTLGDYQSAYFGTENSVSVDNIDAVWYYYGFYLAYQQTNGTQNKYWKTRADSNTSLYLRYIPEFTVRFESEGFDALEETVAYSQKPTLTEPANWQREGYSLVG